MIHVFSAIVPLGDCPTYNHNNNMDDNHTFLTLFTARVRGAVCRLESTARVGTHRDKAETPNTNSHTSICSSNGRCIVARTSCRFCSLPAKLVDFRCPRLSDAPSRNNGSFLSGSEFTSFTIGRWSPRGRRCSLPKVASARSSVVAV